MLTQIDIEDLVQRCRSTNARTYIKEAVDCYRIGSYRACVITTWIAVVYDFIDKLRELGVAGDSVAAKRVAEFDTIQKNRDTAAALTFERDVLKIAKDDFEFISAQEMADLNRLFEDRNRCGHPNLSRDNEIYAPPAELAKLHLRLAIEHVLERPPVQGKAALTMLQATVDGDYFPVKISDAEGVLKVTPLARAKKNVIKDFVMSLLISITREKLSEKKMLQRLAAVQATQRLHSETVHILLQEKFNDAMFKTPDDSLNKVLWLLSTYPDLQTEIKEATWVKLENYVSAMPTTEVDSIFQALLIPRLHEFGINRLEKASKSELSGAVLRLRDKPDDAFIMRCIQEYEKSQNFDDANSIAKELIRPLINYMNSAQAKTVILAGKNGQVKDSNQFMNVASDIRNAGSLTKIELTETIKEAGLETKLAHLMV